MPDNILIQNYPELHNKVILNVDDNEMNHLVISKLLERAGLQIISVGDGEAAVRKLKEGLKPDAILMDLEMPVMNGMEASKVIRTQIDPDIPIIINSGNVDEVEKWKLKRLGIQDFLEKPYTIKDIFSKLAKHIRVAVG